MNTFEKLLLFVLFPVALVGGLFFAWRRWKSVKPTTQAPPPAARPAPAQQASPTQSALGKVADAAQSAANTITNGADEVSQITGDIDGLGLGFNL